MRSDNSRKINIVQKCLDVIDKYFGLVNVIKTLEEHDILGKVIFNENQRTLFNVIKKISTNEQAKVDD
jgi:hypothetical protein